MNREQLTREEIKIPEVQETQEVLVERIESPEDLRIQMLAESKKETDSIKVECADGLVRVEERASKEGLQIDGEDREALVGLSNEADVAKKELETEITRLALPNQENTEPQLEKANISGITKDHNFDGSIIIKTEDAEGRITGYALRKNKDGVLEGNEIRYMKDGSVGPVYQLHESDFAELKQRGVLESYENIPTMKERAVESPDLLDKKEASKKFLAEERAKLAQELWSERKAQHEKLAALKTNIESALTAPENMDGKQEDSRYGEISEKQSNEANTLADRLELSVGLDEQGAHGEQENIAQLIANSDGVSSLKKKLEEHYAKADEIAKKSFESVRKTVEQTLLRNNAFIVHTFLLNEGLRHNANSNISGRATLEDDIDMLLSLEPSISTSSVVPGSKHGLWGNRIGVILGGGDIRGVAQTDEGTTTGGIKTRYGSISSSQEIDEKVSDKSDRGYNELVVNNPKVFGFFQNVDVDDSGKMTGAKEDFMDFMDIAIKKGMPPLIMTPDRRLFEFLSIGDDGVVSVGAEITPEQVALGNAGLANEKRKEIGEEIISKNLFKNIKDQKEAKGIMAELSGEKGRDIELSREEYLAYTKDNQGRFQELPEQLLSDKEFMLEAAHFDPVLAYKHAGENLKRDVGFIEHVYSLEKTAATSSIYSEMPEDIKNNELVALLAVENNDFEGVIDFRLADSPAVWDKIVDKIVEKDNPDRSFSRNVGDEQIFNTALYMSKGFSHVDMTEKLVSDTSFIQKLNSRYPNYKFDIDEYKQLVVKKLSE